MSIEMARLQVYDGISSKISGFCDSIQIVYKNKDKRSGSRRTNSIGVVICIRRISGHLEG